MIKSSHVKIFSKLLLSLDNDQLMSEKQKYWGVNVLVSEIKRVVNAVFLEVLVMEGEIGRFFATRTLDNAYLFMSSGIITLIKG